MLILSQATNYQLHTLLEQSERSETGEFLRPGHEEIAPRFLLELAVEHLSQDPENSFWWSPRLIVVDQLIVGMGGFKSPPDTAGSVEIGYGIVTSQRRRGFATQAVGLLLEEGFSKSEVQTVVAYTLPSNKASWRVLEKNKFFRGSSKIDPDDGEVWNWRRTR
ncbi:MAG: GNAT family N-acetyltransferase [Cyanobacteria bacterium P01_H01_bin.26]